MLLVTQELYTRYRSTYVRWNGEPVAVSGFDDDDSDSIFASITLMDGAEKRISLNTEGLVLGHPELGHINVDDYSMYVARRPDRQYKRGLTPRTLDTRCAVAQELRLLGRRMTDVSSKKFISAVFNPGYVPVEQALQEVATARRLASAFNKKYGFCIVRGGRTPYVMYKGYAAAPVVDGVARLPKDNHHLLEELSQYMRCERV